MDSGIETFGTTIDGVEYSCISIGGKEIELPSFMMQGVKACGYIVKDGIKQAWYWDGLTIAEGKRCIYFEKLPLFPITDIATKKRSRALSLVRELASALASLDTKFLDLSSGILPLWRIWGLEDGGFLILPQSLADLFSFCASENVRSFQSTCWVKQDTHPPFSLCNQMAQLLYFSAMGFPPFRHPDTREDRFRPVPLSLYAGSGLPATSARFIDDTITLSLTRQRDASGNKPSQEALSWFLSRTEQLEWNLQDTAKGMTRDDLTATPACARFIENQKKRADRRIFWRKKGWVVATVAFVVLAVGWFTGSRVKAALTPPYTAGMSDVQIIEEYYAGQNELDIVKMEASLARGTKNPSTMEVTNLFVTKQTRKAYEGVDTQIDPNEWIANGKPPLIEGTYLYGVTDIQISQTGDRQYLATSTLYTPYPYMEENADDATPSAGHTFMYRYRQQQEFTLTESKHGWTEIAQITNKNIEDLGPIEGETVPAANRSVLGQSQ
jgi:hypothetical protein